jgi:hypothetical protein
VLRTESDGIGDVAGIASRLEMPDTAWRIAKGPSTRIGDATWLRGNLGGIACVVVRDEGSLVHVMRRDGTPVAIVRDTGIREDRTVTV